MNFLQRRHFLTRGIVADKGYVRVLAATAPSTSPATRSLQLMSATLPGFEYTTWYAMYAPLATPASAIAHINAALQKVLKDPALEAKIEPHGAELLPSTPEEVNTWVKRARRSGPASSARQASRSTELAP